MLQKLNKSRGGFTLVEIMIVVAIIALLAAIAVPGFLRSRKRSQATNILNDARVLDGALNQYAIENNKPGTFDVSADTSVFKPYLKDGSRLYDLAKTKAALTDTVNNSFVYGKLDAGVKVSTATTLNFTDVIDGTAFWAGFNL